MITQNHIVRASPKVAARIVDGQAVIVEPRSGMVNVLNDVGARMWELADGSRTASAIIDLLIAEFDADPGLIRGDALAFMADLLDKGLLESEAPADRP